MIVITKREAEKKSLESLFNQGGTITLKDKRVFCTGKYNKTIVGGNVVDLPNVKLVWAENRSDKEGGFYKLYCI